MDRDQQHAHGWTKVFHASGIPVWSNDTTGEITWTDPHPAPVDAAVAAAHAAAHLHRSRVSYHYFHWIEQCAAVVTACACPLCVGCCVLVNPHWTLQFKDAVRSIYDDRLVHPSVNGCDVVQRHAHDVAHVLCTPCHALWHCIAAFAP
jgi:hypothetical protein